MSETIRIAVTGAAGQIGYSLLFRLASGEVFGADQKIDLRLLEVPAAMKAAEGTGMELLDCAFPTIESMNITDSAEEAFDGVHWALLIGSKPRGPGMERSDLIRENGSIFVHQGKALQKADRDIRVIVVGNPCNTNALIAMHHARDLPKERFSAMTQLDENRGKAQLAKKLKTDVSEIRRLAIWGNHSPTMYPDFEQAVFSDDARSVEKMIADRSWLETTFMTTVQKRGAEIIAARGKSSAASAASALIDHINNMKRETVLNNFYSSAVISDHNSYGIEKGLMFSFPMKTKKTGSWEIVEGIKLSDYARRKIKITEEELLKERNFIKDLID